MYAGEKALLADDLIRALQDTLESECPWQRTIAELSHLQLQLLTSAHKLQQRDKQLSFKVRQIAALHCWLGDWTALYGFEAHGHRTVN